VTVAWEGIGTKAIIQLFHILDPPLGYYLSLDLSLFLFIRYSPRQALVDNGEVTALYVFHHLLSLLLSCVYHLNIYTISDIL
jgi:hypothetical protein